MAVLRFTTMRLGAQFVMITGILVIPVCCAISLGSLVPYQLLAVQHMVRVLILSGLMMCSVREERPLCLTVLITIGDHTIVGIKKMQVLCVTIS